MLKVFPFMGCSLLLDSDDWMLQDIVHAGKYEPYVLEPFLGAITPQSVVLDIGANVGAFAIPAAKKAARVIAVEMIEKNARLIAVSAQHNDLSNVDVYPCAVSDRFGLVTFDIVPGSNSTMVQKPLSLETMDRLGVTLCVPIDMLLNGAQPDIVKIDIEGSEYLALKNAEQLWDVRPIFFIEYSPDLQCRISGAEGRDLLDLFFSRGYRATILHRDMRQEAADAERINESWLEYMSNQVTHIDLMMSPPA